MEMTGGCKGDCSCSEKVPVISGSKANIETENVGVEDIWGDDDIEDLQNSTADIKRMHTKQGYLDGISNAKESSLQEGFDDLYPKGAQLGIAVGGILGALASNSDQELFKQAKEELNISRVLQKEYFNQDLDLKEEKAPEIVSKWQEIVQNLEKK